MPPTGHSQTPGQPFWALPTPDTSYTVSCLSGSNPALIYLGRAWRWVASSTRLTGALALVFGNQQRLSLSPLSPKPQNCSPTEAGEVCVGKGPTLAPAILTSTCTGRNLPPLRTLPAVPPEAKKGLLCGALLPSPPPRLFFLITTALTAPESYL